MALQSLDIKQRSATTTPAPQARTTIEIAKLIGYMHSEVGNR